MQNNIVYTTETPYSEIWSDFRLKYNVNGGPSLHELERIHSKWRQIGKLAKAGKLTGMKY